MLLEACMLGVSSMCVCGGLYLVEGVKEVVWGATMWTEEMTFPRDFSLCWDFSLTHPILVCKLVYYSLDWAGVVSKKFIVLCDARCAVSWNRFVGVCDEGSLQVKQFLRRSEWMAGSACCQQDFCKLKVFCLTLLELLMVTSVALLPLTPMCVLVCIMLHERSHWRMEGSVCLLPWLCLSCAFFHVQHVTHGMKYMWWIEYMLWMLRWLGLWIVCVINYTCVWFLRCVGLFID